MGELCHSSVGAYIYIDSGIGLDQQVAARDAYSTGVKHE